MCSILSGWGTSAPNLRRRLHLFSFVSSDVSIQFCSFTDTRELIIWSVISGLPVSLKSLLSCSMLCDQLGMYSLRKSRGILFFYSNGYILNIIFDLLMECLQACLWKFYLFSLVVLISGIWMPMFQSTGVCWLRGNILFSTFRWGGRLCSFAVRAVETVENVIRRTHYNHECTWGNSRPFYYKHFQHAQYIKNIDNLEWVLTLLI